MNVEYDIYDLIFKIILIGDSGVGKTNILTRYVNNEFSFSTQSTVGVEFSGKTIKKDGKTIKLQIWDTAGEERYRSITSAYYKGSKGAFVVYDISNRVTFENINKWIDELKSKGDEDIIIMLVGNKSDLEDKREVQIEEVENKSKLNHIAFCETSAKNGKNIEEAFDSLINEIMKSVEKAKKIELKKLQNSKPIILEEKENEEEENQKKNQSCC